LTLALSRVDVHDVIAQAVEVCRAGIVECGLELTLDLAARHHHLQGDAARLQQVYWNLIKNAIKFTPRGGRITIRSWNPPAGDPAEKEPRVLTVVSDTGVGIEPDRLPRIFNAFEQRDPRQQRLHGGLGLGLAISRSIVLAHGGSLSAQSGGKNRGTAFTVGLLAQEFPGPVSLPEENKEEDLNGSVRPKGLRILLVDDNRDTLRYLAGVLKESGHNVSSAVNYRAASRLAALNTYDLLISDIELPDGTGLDIIRDLHERQSTPGIALSGFGSADDIGQSHAAGFDEHLIKPIDVRSLHAAIARVTTAQARNETSRAGRGGVLRTTSVNRLAPDEDALVG
jgi:CheY-like chemotaxis protein